MTPGAAVLLPTPTKTPVDEGLKTISATMASGPGGAVPSVGCGIGRRGVMGVRPVVGETA